MTEPLGNDMDVYMSSTLSDHIVGRVEATQSLPLDQAATVYVDTNRVHFFEPGETGMNLSLRGGDASSSRESAHALA